MRASVKHKLILLFPICEDASPAASQIEFVSIREIGVKKSFVAFGCSARHFGNVNELGKFLVIAGLLLAAVGALLWSGFGKGWLGRLPGDIHYSKGDFSFHFPIVTCLLLSAILTLLLWLFRR